MKRRKDQFDFKQFSIKQSRAAMKVGTDGVLLGAWANIETAHHILDIGTGTGLIALMLAQRNADAYIDAIEIDAPAYNDAIDNSMASLWSERITVFNGSIQDYSAATPTRYDHIVSNPPFFVNSTPSPIENRHHARHTATLSTTELLTAAERLLSKKGKLSLIIPVTEEKLYSSEALRHGLFLTRKTTFYPKNTKPAERYLIEFSREMTSIEESELVQYDEDGQWSKDYINLTKAFYIKL